jgi:glycerol kinase
MEIFSSQCCVGIQNAMKRLNDLYVLGVDQGTSGTMAALYDHKGLQVGSVDKKVHSFSPKPGWVEQDPYELLDSIFLAVRQLIYESEISPNQIVSFGLANQGESLLVWDRCTGKPVYNVIGWQCTRSADLCDRLKQAGFEKEFRARTGLQPKYRGSWSMFLKPGSSPWPVDWFTASLIPGSSTSSPAKKES